MKITLQKPKIISLIIVIGVLGTLILQTQNVATLSTFFLFIIITILGLFLCENLRFLVNDPKLKFLGYFWLIKILLTFILLFAGWIPQLDLASSSFGYDPQRYYFQSQELIENNWIFLGGLNYVGILYFYGAIFAFFGHNPVVPALINSFVTLLASLLLIKVGYLIQSQRNNHNWKIAFVLLLPDILWFDVMTSRETILGALIIFVLLTIGEYFYRITLISLKKLLFIVIISLIAIAAIRTSMLIPVLLAIFLMMIAIKHQRKSSFIKKIIPFLLAVLFIILIPLLTINLGGSEFGLLKSIQIATAANQNVTTELYMGSQNSIGMLLFPDGIIQSILFIPPRMILYSVAPLPNMSVSVINMFEGSWQEWQKLFALLSSLINVVAMPYALALLIHSIKNRKIDASPLIFAIPFWVTFIAIAGGNLIIQERYRVMSTILFFGCAWLGARICTRQLINKTSLTWYGTLGSGALFYLFYKFVF